MPIKSQSPQWRSNGGCFQFLVIFIRNCFLNPVVKKSYRLCYKHYDNQHNTSCRFPLKEPGCQSPLVPLTRPLFWLTFDPRSLTGLFVHCTLLSPVGAFFFWRSGFAPSCFFLSAAHNGRRPTSFGVTLPRCFPARNIFYRPSCSFQIPAHLPIDPSWSTPSCMRGRLQPQFDTLDGKFSLLLQSFSLSWKYNNHD